MSGDNISATASSRTATSQPKNSLYSMQKCMIKRLVQIQYRATAIAQVVGCHPLIAEAKIQSQASSHSIFYGKSDNVTGFSLSTSVIPSQYHSTDLRN
jgi:hypothetical protein